MNRIMGFPTQSIYVNASPRNMSHRIAFVALRSFLLSIILIEFEYQQFVNLNCIVSNLIHFLFHAPRPF